MAMFADSTGDGGYHQLVGQITELQAELTKTVAVCGQLRRDHDTASKERDSLQVEVANLRDKYAQARRQVLEEAQVRRPHACMHA
jgi:regulator of replication initiation timing